METIEQKLNKISEFQAQADLLEMERLKLIDEMLDPDTKAAMAAVNAEFNDKAQVVAEKIAALKQEIEGEIITNGATVKGQHLSAQFNKGRVSWDAKVLDGFALTHPEILFARKEGQPYVTFKNNKGG